LRLYWGCALNLCLIENQGWQREHPIMWCGMQSCGEWQQDQWVVFDHGGCCKGWLHPLDLLCSFLYCQVYCRRLSREGWSWIQAKPPIPQGSCVLWEGFWVDRCWWVKCPWLPSSWWVANMSALLHKPV